MNIPTAENTDWSSVADAPGLDEARFANDDKLFVEFFRKPALQAGESREKGRAIYKEIDYIRIMVPGDKLSVVVRPVDSIDERRFKDRYERWKAGAGNVIEGTPLTSLPCMTPAKVEEYKYFNIHTVEQLSEAADSVGQNFMGFSSDKRAAVAFIELAKGNAPLEKMNAELKERDAKIEEMQAQITELMKISSPRKSKKKVIEEQTED